jgi:hypothetical protein
MSYARLGLTGQRAVFSDSSLMVILTVTEEGRGIFSRLLDVPNNQAIYEDDPAWDVLEPIVRDSLSENETLLGDWGEHVRFKVVSSEVDIEVLIESNGRYEQWVLENNGAPVRSIKDLISYRQI